MTRDTDSGGDDAIRDELRRLHDDDIPAPRPEFRDALLDATSRRVSAFAWRRRLAAAAAILAIYVAGAASGYLWREPEVAPIGTPEPGEDPGRIETPTGDPHAPRVVTPEDPRELRRTLRPVIPARRRQILRDAGDEYLGGERFDPESALYCYQQLLDEMPQDASTVPDADDSWLLKHLKLARAAN